MSSMEDVNVRHSEEEIVSLVKERESVVVVAFSTWAKLVELGGSSGPLNQCSLARASR